MKKQKGMQYAEYTGSTKDNPSFYYLFNQTFEIDYYLFIGQKQKMRNLFE